MASHLIHAFDRFHGLYLLWNFDLLPVFNRYFLFDLFFPADSNDFGPLFVFFRWGNLKPLLNL